MMTNPQTTSNEEILKRARIFRARIQKKPCLFYDNVLGCGYWDMQEQATNSVFLNLRTAIGSCHGAGKTYIAARIALAFLYAFEFSIVITTAPTFRQVRDMVWGEIRSAFARSKVYLGEAPLKTRFEIEEKWYAVGLSSDKADNFQGYHAKHILVIVDEAAGVKPPILEATEGLLTSANVHLLYIGNTTVPNGPFYDAFKDDAFHKIKISVFDTPNFEANGIRTLSDLKKFNKREELQALELPFPELVTPLWAWEAMNRWGEDSPIFKARALAEFPTEGKDVLIGLNYVEQAAKKVFDEQEVKTWPRCNVIGIDVARFGDDDTVFHAMNNYKTLEVDWHHGKDLMKTVGRAISLFKELGFDKKQDRFIVDDTGLGGGVTDRLREEGYNVVPINSGSRSSDENFVNLKAEMLWYLRDLFRSGKIHILEKGKTMGQLPTIKFFYTSKGMLQIVSKEQMKKDGFKSPDFADALALAAWATRIGEAGKVGTPSKDEGTVAGNLMSMKF